MPPMLAQIEARLTERPPAALKRFDIEAGLGEKPSPFGRQGQFAVAASEQTAADKAIEHRDRKIARQMMGAGACVAQFRIARSVPDPKVTGASRHRHQRLKRG